MVKPGDCNKLVVTSIPKMKEVQAVFWVPVLGSFSVWFEDKIVIPDTEDDQPHWNYNLPVGEAINNAWVRPSETLISGAGKHGLFNDKHIMLCGMCNWQPKIKTSLLP